MSAWASRGIGLAAVLALWPTVTRADRLILTNGRALEGIITRQTDTHVTIDLGVGSMTVQRRSVSSIERSESGNATLSDQWRRKHFLHPKYVPCTFAGLARDYERLLAQRREAKAANARLIEMKRRETENRSRQDRLRGDLVAVSQALSRRPPAQDAQAYNELVWRNNTLRAELTVCGNELAVAVESQRGAMGAVAGYLEALTAFEKAFTDARAALEAAGATPGEAETFFIARMAERIASHRAEFPEMSVNGARHSNGVVVNVTVNDRARGVFLVDTGAMLVTLSEPFARRAGLTPVAGPAIQMVTADGRQINAVPVTLGTVQVGDARMESVDAAVIPSAVSPDIDGLLGMSFLHNFAVQIDAARGRLCLRRFAPGRDPAPEGNP